MLKLQLLFELITCIYRYTMADHGRPYSTSRVCMTMRDGAINMNFAIILLVIIWLSTAILDNTIIIYVDLLTHQISFQSIGVRSDTSLVRVKERPPLNIFSKQ